MAQEAATNETNFGFLNRQLDEAVLPMTKLAFVAVRVAGEEVWIRQSVRQGNDLGIKQTHPPYTDADLRDRNPASFKQFTLRLGTLLTLYSIPF